MENVYLCWGLYVFALSCQWSYWSVAPENIGAKQAANHLKLTGQDRPATLAADLVLLVAGLLLADLVWPFLAASHFKLLYEPRVLSMLMMIVGAIVLGFFGGLALQSVGAVIVVGSAHFPMAKARYAAIITVAVIVSTTLAFGVLLSNPGY